MGEFPCLHHRFHKGGTYQDGPYEIVKVPRLERRVLSIVRKREKFPIAGRKAFLPERIND
jgi:hypothetical protein